MNGFNNLGAQMLYNPPTIEDPPNKRMVYKGYTKEQVQEIANEAANKTAASWKEYSFYLRARKGAISAALNEVHEGRIDVGDKEATKQFIREREQQIAYELGIDFEEARKKFNL